MSISCHRNINNNMILCQQTYSGVCYQVYVFALKHKLRRPAKTFISQLPFMELEESPSIAKAKFTPLSSSLQGTLTICKLTKLAAHPGVERTWYRGTLRAAGGHRAWLKKGPDANNFWEFFFGKLVALIILKGGSDLASGQGLPYLGDWPSIEWLWDGQTKTQVATN